MNGDPTPANQGVGPAGDGAATDRQAARVRPDWRTLCLWSLTIGAVVSVALFIGIWISDVGAEETRQRVLIVTGLLSIVTLTVLALWKIPQWQAQSARARTEDGTSKTPFDIENEARATLGEIVAGLGVIAGLAFTWYQITDSRIAADRALETTRQGQNTERFTQAINQLGSATVDVRVGGIYSLERIALDAPDTYYRPVMEVLAGYVREHNQVSQQADGQTEQNAIPPSTGLPPDVEAALVVVARRPTPPEGTGDFRLDLSGADLRNVSLVRANLEGVNLSGARLVGADLTEANLHNATLISVVATGQVPVILLNTCLTGANLLGSDISPGLIAVAITNEDTILPNGERGARQGGPCVGV